MQASNATIRNQFEWGSIEWLANGEVGNSKELSLARMLLRPGMATDTHIHANCEESIYVVRGTVQCRRGAQRVVLGAGDRSVVPRGAVHAIRNTGSEPAEIVLCYSSAAREFALAEE
ncbi:MAG TPA: cupin domain-containing protein [Burkholderiales bacterium]|nr:cupin domain-containing protein [Burkholderiales bacterium]